MEMDLLEEKKGTEAAQNQNSSDSDGDFPNLTETIERVRDGEATESSAMDEHLLDEILQQHSQEDDAADGA
jgi:hypothetical protein